MAVAPGDPPADPPAAGRTSAGSMAPNVEASKRRAERLYLGSGSARDGIEAGGVFRLERVPLSRPGMGAACMTFPSPDFRRAR